VFFDVVQGFTHDADEWAAALCGGGGQGDALILHV
jgi:hypothetical protein